MVWSCQLVKGATSYEFHDLANGKALIRLEGRGFPSLSRFTYSPAIIDGDVYKSMRYGARQLEVVHAIQGSSYADLQDQRLLLADILSPKPDSVDGTKAVLQWQADVGEPIYELDVQIAGSFEFGTHAGLNTEIFNIPLVADYPFWRKTPATTSTISIAPSGISVPISVPIEVTASSNSVTATNNGNAISYPTITITAGSSGMQNPKITNTTTNEVVEVTETMASGDVMVIDMAARTITLNGSSIIQKRTPESVTWGLVSGDNVISAFTGVGTATLDIAYYDLYAAV